MSDRIKALRAEKGMTQEDLAEASGVSRLTISKLETGKLTNARSKTMFAVAKALGVTIDDLFFDRDA